MTQQLHGRRGAVFGVRLTDEERHQIEAAQARGGGPRSLGAWMRWAALQHASGEVVPAQRAGAGSTGPGAPRPGTTPTAAIERVSPARGRVSSSGSTSSTAPPVTERVILDLCGGCGAWSNPYREAGYDVRLVTLPEHDVRTYVPPPRVWGVLAAPPCTEFSPARHGSRSRRPSGTIIPRPPDHIAGMECVNACMRIILQTQPRWWALENPVGALGAYLGTPRDVWEPCDFGDPWTKRTALWGDFAIPTRGPFVEPLGGGPFCTTCDPTRRRTTWCSNAAHRAITPPGFARAFAQANP